MILLARTYHRNSKTRAAPPSALYGAQRPAGRLARRGKAQRLECRGVGRRRCVSSRRASPFRRHARGNAFRRARWRSSRARHRPPRPRRTRHGRAVRAHGLRGPRSPASLRQAARRRSQPRNHSPAFELVRTRRPSPRLRRIQNTPRALRAAQQDLFRSPHWPAPASPRSRRAPSFFRRRPARLCHQQRPPGQPRRNDVARRRAHAKPV